MNTIFLSTLNYRIASILLAGTAILLMMATPMQGNPFLDNDYYGRHISTKAPDFSLKNTHDQLIHLEDFQGRFIYLMFGYINCDKLCHSQVLTFYALNHKLKSANVEFVYIGMDPERDSAEKVSLYFDDRGHKFTGLIAQNMLQAQNVAASYHAYFNKESSVLNKHYSINHPGIIYLIDPTGHLRLIYIGTALNTDLMISDFKTIETELSKLPRLST